MPQPVERVVRERHRDGELGRGLEHQRPGREGGRQHAALEVPAQRRRDQVQAAEEVEGAREGDARHAVERRPVPGYLRLVDAQVGGDGAVEALFGEDFGRGFVVGEGLGRGVSLRVGLVGGLLMGRRCWEAGFTCAGRRRRCCPLRSRRARRTCRQASGRPLCEGWWLAGVVRAHGAAARCIARLLARRRKAKGLLTPPGGLLSDSLSQHCAGCAS